MGGQWAVGGRSVCWAVWAISGWAVGGAKWTRFVVGVWAELIDGRWRISKWITGVYIPYIEIDVGTFELCILLLSPFV